MNMLFLYNCKQPPAKLYPDEVVGPPVSHTWIDPFSDNHVEHKGYSIEELEEKGFVGIYLVFDRGL
jgi:hypothetical protein